MGCEVYSVLDTSSGATATLWVKRCFGIRAEQHLAVRLEVDVQHVVRVRYAWVSRLKLDGLPEHLHRSLPYICSLPLQTYHLAFLTEQEYGRFFRVHLSFWKLSLQEFVVYSVNTHSPWTLRRLMCNSGQRRRSPDRMLHQTLSKGW